MTGVQTCALPICLHPDCYERAALLAAVDFELGSYVESERLAQQATTKMSKAVLSNPKAATVRLMLIAAAARLHDEAIKKSALADLADYLPALTTLSAIRKWMSPQANLYGYVLRQSPACRAT